MPRKPAPRSINVAGSVLGIGNVIGDYSTAHVEIHWSLFSFNKLVVDESKTRLELNPNFTADQTRAFLAHPDSSHPELRHLIGHRAQAARATKMMILRVMDGE